jgi:uncharacterized protein YdhG (YjbR/CyaY superfamily)
MSEIDDFLEGLPDPQRHTFQAICEVVTRVAPQAEHGKSYGMAAFRAGGKPLLGMTASREHLSVHPFSPAVVEAVAEDLAGFSRSKGTVRFTPENPLPDEVVERMVRLRLAEIG